MSKSWYFIPVLLFPILFSCVQARQATYFNNLRDSTILTTVENLDPVIQRNDLLEITVSSANPEASKVFASPGPNGYLVNQDGAIQFPVLGTLKVAGLSKKDLKMKLQKSLLDNKLLIDPLVDIRYINFRVTVIGEVAHPTVITVSSEKISLLEAIGMAGDLTIHAKRKQVLVLREGPGTRTAKRLDLTSTDLFTSPYYYLQTNDVVYVEPDKAKIAGSGRTNQVLPLLLSGLSFGLLVVDRIVK